MLWNARLLRNAELGADSVARGKRAGAALFRVFFSLLYFLHSRFSFSSVVSWRTFYVSVSRNCDCIAVSAMSAACAANVMVMATGDEAGGTLDRARPSAGVSECRLHRDNWEIAGAARHAETKDFHGARRDHVVCARTPACGAVRTGPLLRSQLFFFFFCSALQASNSCDERPSLRRGSRVKQRRSIQFTNLFAK